MVSPQPVNDANDVSTKIRLIKAAAAATNPLPNYKLRELGLIVEEVSQKLHKYQSDIAQHYDKILKTIRRFKVPESYDELIKAVAAHLQVEKTVKKSKVIKVLTTILQETDTFRSEWSRDNTAQPQQEPAKTMTSC